MTAVRFAGDAITYGQLRERLCAYDRVASRAGLSELAGLSAALMSLMPEGRRTLTPAAQAQWVAEAMAWLGRESAEADIVATASV